MLKQIASVIVTYFLPFGLMASGSVLDGWNLKALGGKEIPVSDLRGKVVLITNIATKCGHTPQLEGLQKLHEKYSAKGLLVVGVPSNDFGGQTPEDAAGIEKFCKFNYGVKFKVTEKIQVLGEGKHPFIAKLLAASPEKSEIKWNFEKFLVGKDGQVTHRFLSKTQPLGGEIERAVEGLLK